MSSSKATESFCFDHITQYIYKEDNKSALEHLGQQGTFKFWALWSVRDGKGLNWAIINIYWPIFSHRHNLAPIWTVLHSPNLKQRKQLIIRTHKTNITINKKPVQEKKLVTSRKYFFMLCIKWIIIKRYSHILEAAPASVAKKPMCQQKG